jgi:hypothetical protein
VFTGEFINLVYVAVTRAKQRLYLSPEAMDYYQLLLSRAGLPPHSVPKFSADTDAGSGGASRDEEPASAHRDFRNVPAGAHTTLSEDRAEELCREFERKWELFTADFGGKKAPIDDVGQVSNHCPFITNIGLNTMLQSRLND